MNNKIYFVIVEDDKEIMCRKVASVVSVTMGECCKKFMRRACSHPDTLNVYPMPTKKTAEMLADSFNKAFAET